MRMKVRRFQKLTIFLLPFCLVLAAFALVRSQEPEAEPIFSATRGFYSQPFDLTISDETAGARISYTLDGSDPRTSSTATTMPSPLTLRIDPQNTTNRDKAPGVVVRAFAHKNGDAQTRVATHSFLYLELIGELSPDGQRPGPGWPAANTTDENRQMINYGMDPQVLNDSRYRGQIVDALLAIPTFSLVTDLKNLFDPTTGIYMNPMSHGRDWERPVSVELLIPDGSEGFQIDSGLRIRGGYSRNYRNPKHAFRLMFRSEYGQSRLKYPLFEDEGVDEFENIDLRCSQNYSWSYDGSSENTCIREVFSRDAQRDMGQPYTRSRYYHVYLNGTYWGLFQTQERPEASFAASYFGGVEDDYDVIKVNAGPGLPYEIEATDGNLDAWRDLWQASISGFDKPEVYRRVQGENPDGSRNYNDPVLLDVDNLIDYMLCTFYVGDFDSPVSNFLGNQNPNNFYSLYNRSAKNQGFFHFRHDAEHSMFNRPESMDRTGPYPAGQRFEHSNPHWLHQNLVSNPDYVMRFADRVQKHFFNGGALTPEACRKRLVERKQQIETAIIAESARWGDSKRSTPFTKADWENAVNWIINTYVSTRTNVVLGQLRNKGWFPSLAAPTFNRSSGKVEKGFQLEIENQGGVVFYTLDGLDPVVPQVSEISFTKTLVADQAAKKILVPTENLGISWRVVAEYDDSGWRQVTGDPGGVGYENGSGYENYISFDVGSQMADNGSNPTANTSCYVRTLFQVDEQDLAQIGQLTLYLRYDDGFAAYLNGTLVASSNAPTVLSWNSMATANHEADGIDQFDLSEHRNRLKVGQNLLAIQGLNVSLTSSDFLILPELVASDRKIMGGAISASAIEYRQPIPITATSYIKARAKQGNEFSPLNEIILAVQEDMSKLRVTEIHYHPLDEGDVSGREFEFIEFKNIGSTAINLTAAAFVNGIDYTFPAASSFAAGSFLVLASNAAAFFSRYGFYPFGEYQGQLDNAGERLVFVQAAGDTVFSIRYNDRSPWPTTPDVLGYSLVPINTVPFLDYNDPASWTASANVHGSPGADDLATDVKNSSAIRPTEFRLWQNYPNPFNPSTMIRFAVPKSGKVRLTIFDVLGRQVRTLVDRNTSPGEYALQWDASAMAGGVYFCRLEGSGYSETRKLLLLK